MKKLIMLLGLSLLLSACSTAPSMPSAPAQSSSEMSEAASSASPISMENWKTFVNKKYRYSLRHSPETAPMSNAYATDPEQAFSLVIGPLMIRILDPREFGGQYPEMTKASLWDAATVIWQANRDDKPTPTTSKIVGPLTKTTVNGRQAYSFTLVGSYQDTAGGFVLDAPSTFLYFRKDGLNYEAWYEDHDENIAHAMLATFTDL